MDVVGTAIHGLWGKVEVRLREKGFDDREVRNSKISFTAGLRAALMVTLQYGATTLELDRAATAIEPE
jgi:hypothetical protein